MEELDSLSEEEMEVRFVKLRENAKLPYKKHANDAGYDLSWAPSNGEIGDFYRKKENDDGKFGSHELFRGARIDPGQSVLFKTGLKALFPDGFVMEIKNRSGIAAKKGLLVGACIVDSTYRGEIFVNLHNVSKECQFIEEGDRIAQAIFFKIENVICSQISEQEYSEFETSRSDGALGSTGVK